MKVKLIIIVGCLGLLAGCASQGCYSGCDVCSDCPTTSSSQYGSCSCVDPACKPGANSCLSPGQCCTVFGNIGYSTDND